MDYYCYCMWHPHTLPDEQLRLPKGGEIMSFVAVAGISCDLGEGASVFFAASEEGDNGEGHVVESEAFGVGWGVDAALGVGQARKRRFPLSQ